ncbi:hypothetical protein SAMN04488137_3782 [Fictibacillus solisalsi]|uniref:Spore coat protein Z n=1 Tax=Fictibacillus solisalsi TaxID=459525 RepID=A0A1G9ZVT2_9BACL|nr:hypothetical protein SAMN04488137_3782 [Fictibacillus solisalsi]
MSIHKRKIRKCGCWKSGCNRCATRPSNCCKRSPQNEARCECRSEFAGLKVQNGGFIEGNLCTICRFGIELGYTAPGLDFQAVLLETATCPLNNTMRAIGIGRLSGRLVDFELNLRQNPNTIRLRVFKCQETFIDTTFRGSEVARVFIIRCPR